MPKFKVMVADDQGHTLYDEWIEAAGPKEACAIAVADAGTADVAETEEQTDPVMPLGRGPLMSDGRSQPG
ncbi:MAG: hypothetical protein ACRYGP_30390 [Janthinobacterium lividum]